MRKLSLLISISLSLALCATPSLAALTVEKLRCEFQVDPLGVDVTQPRLTWVLQSSQRGELQMAYQILAASSPQNLQSDQGDLWDSGIIKSAETAHIVYGGKPLHSAEQVFWKVRSWNAANAPSAWSTPAKWTMGPLDELDWSAAKWITAATDSGLAGLIMRRGFDVKPGLSRALVYVCGLGQYEFTINGQKVGNDLLTPGWSKYDKTCLYDSYDITSMLKQGAANGGGLMLGNGMYNVLPGRYTKFRGSFGPQKAIALIRLEYADGTVERIGTDEKWRITTGPITFSSVYGGEDFDARREPAGWNKPGFDDSNWQPATISSGPGGKLRGLSVSAPPVRAFDVFKPAAPKTLANGQSVYDFGQNASMMLRLKVHGPAGSVVKVTPAELVKADGSVDRGSSGGGEAYWKYTLAGGGNEDYFSKFYYHGCRYLQVERLPATTDGELPVIDSIEGVVVHSSSEPVGQFTSSNELFNRTHTLIRWAQRSNMVSVLTDCPHRERLGWLEQAYLNGPSLRYEFDLASFFNKMMNDMADSQTIEGLIPDIAPEYTKFAGGFRDSPEWGSAFILCAWQQYEWTGDTQLLDRYYDGMKRYVGFLKNKSKDNIVSHGLGDWYDIGPGRPGQAQLTPLSLTATATYYADIKVMESAARLLGKPQDAQEFAALADQVKQAYNKMHYHAESGTYATNSQTANAMSLALGLCDPADAPRVVEAIVKDFRDRGNALTAGDVGYTYLLKALAAGGRSDVIFDMNNQSDKPGYGYQLAKGATALTEAWDARAASSQNHFMLGHIMEWFYHDLAGIQIDPAAPGFKQIIIKPAIVGDLTFVKGSYSSIHGPIQSEWKRDGQNLTLHVSIPANTTARVYVPAADPAMVNESGKLASQSDQVKFIRAEQNCALFQIASGEYTFSSTMAQVK